MLEKIKSREDLLSLTNSEEEILCKEIREFLVEHVARTGGHLASNLGVVELTLALHKVYNTEKDRLVFDVGHQSYVHKILTGRMDRFDTLRTFGGLAGFPKPAESAHDAFIAGHASNAVSVALGMARARTLQNEDYDVVAVLGDGALSGGLAYEGLNDAGTSKEPFVVVLNDNGMSINRNVGAMARHLSLVRLKPGYFELKRAYRQITTKLFGNRFYLFSSRMKDKVRQKLLGVTVFEEMGFHYLGPVDGHDTEKLTFLLQQAKEMHEPVLLHVITRKGKGYVPAEDKPTKFHGIGQFDPDTGKRVKSGNDTFSQTFGQTLCELAEDDARICAVTAAMETGTGLEQFADKYPDRYFDVGIAEGHAVSMAAGLAKQGMTPVFAVYSTFLQRSYDMMLHDVSLLGLHVVFAVDRSGLVGEDGETHHGVFDVGYLRQIPGLQVLCPASQAEMRRMLHCAVSERTGPVAVRYPKGGDGIYTDDTWSHVRSEDSRLTFATYGTTVNDILQVHDRLKGEGIPTDVIKLDRIDPLDLEDIIDSVSRTGRLIVAEETADHGCLAYEIFSRLSGEGIRFAGRKHNLGEGIVPHGELASLKRFVSLDAESIYQTAKELLHEE